MEDAAEKKVPTIEADQSTSVAHVAVGASETAVAATTCGAATAMPAPTAIAAVELLVGKQEQDKVAQDLEQEKRKRKREVHDEYEEMFEENRIEELDEDFRKGSEFDEDAIDELSEEDDEDVGYDMDNRHSKSRYTLKHLIAGKIKYHRYGKIFCPFCGRAIVDGFDCLIQHAVDLGNALTRKKQPSTLAKHAAFGVFLTKYVRGNEHYYIPPMKKAKK